MPHLTRRAVLVALTGLSTAAFAADKAEEKGWKPLFDGKSLGSWKKTEFAGAGEVHVDKDFKGGPAIVVEAGDTLTGINWTKDAPRTNFEIALETMKIEGEDFQLGLTFPVGDSYASLILGGWGGPVTGISSIDNSDASENATTKYIDYARNKWYRVKVRVTPEKIEAWLDDKQIVDQEIKGKKIGLRAGSSISQSVPIGLCTYKTKAAYTDIKIRSLEKQ